MARRKATGPSSASRARKDGVPFDGGTTERMPLIIGEDRLIPGFEANLVGLKAGESTTFDITFPEDYPETSLAGEQVQFAVDLKELREKVLPEADDAFAQSMGDYADLAALKADVAERLRRGALDRARHEFSDKIIDYAVANSTIDLPAILVDQEVEVMHDEFRQTIARQGISEPAYLKATEKTEADLHTEFRPRAEQRVEGPPGPLEGRRDRGHRRPRRRRRGAGRARPPALRRRPEDHPLLRVRARPQLHPEHAAPHEGRRDAGRPLARRPPGPSGAAAPRGRRHAVRRRGARGRGRRLHRCHRSGLHPRRDRRRGRGALAHTRIADRA